MEWCYLLVMMNSENDDAASGDDNDTNKWWPKEWRRVVCKRRCQQHSPRWKGTWPWHHQGEMSRGIVFRRSLSQIEGRGRDSSCIKFCIHKVLISNALFLGLTFCTKLAQTWRRCFLLCLGRWGGEIDAMKMTLMHTWERVLPIFSGFGFLRPFPILTPAHPDLNQTGQSPAPPAWQPDSPPEIQIENTVCNDFHFYSSLIYRFFLKPF